MVEVYLTVSILEKADSCLKPLLPLGVKSIALLNEVSFDFFQSVENVPEDERDMRRAVTDSRGNQYLPLCAKALAPIGRATLVLDVGEDGASAVVSAQIKLQYEDAKISCALGSLDELLQQARRMNALVEYEGFVNFDEERIRVSFYAPDGASDEEKNAAFLAALLKQHQVTFRSVS